jgi:hypothetical protein
MKKIISLILISICSISFSQDECGPPADAINVNDIYQCMELWIIQFNTCVNPTWEECDPYGDYLGTSLIYFMTSEQCCCEELQNTGFVDPSGNCDEYDNGGQPGISLDENTLDSTNGLYIDLLGRVYKEQPKGVSVMNGVKYYKF